MFFLTVAMCLLLSAQTILAGTNVCEYPPQEPQRVPLRPSERSWSNYIVYNPPQFSVECYQCDRSTPQGYTFNKLSQRIDRRRIRACLRRPKYLVDADGYPLNPAGRTGLRGRGLLPRWGPNHLLKLIFARKNQNGTQILMRNEAPGVLPSTYVDLVNGQWFDIDTAVEIVGVLTRLTTSNEKSRRIIQKAQKSSKELISGSIPAAENTDNAWIELHVRLVNCDKHPEYCVAVAEVLKERGYQWTFSDEKNAKKMHHKMLQAERNFVLDSNLELEDYSVFCRNRVIRNLKTSAGIVGVVSLILLIAFSPFAVLAMLYGMLSVYIGAGFYIIMLLGSLLEVGFKLLMKC